jgi:anaerobic magnesium-protoporphyrin IX monomethyl ester cyclase
MIKSVLLTRPFSVGKKETPMNLLYVGTALKNSGYGVEIVDLQDNPSREEEIIKSLENSPEKILGISALSLHYRWLKIFTKKVKDRSPKTVIVVGGHIAITAELLLEKTSVDFVCTGEGETTFPELIDTLNKNLPPEKVLGLVLRKDGKIIKTGFRSLIKNFVHPDYDLIDMSKYVIHPSEDMFFKNSPEYKKRERPDDRQAVIMFSRGCVGGCNFCYRHLPGFRQESVEWSWDQVMLLRNKYGIKYFRVNDELFNNDPEWLKAFHHKFMESKTDILFRIAGLRADLVNDEQLKMLKKMGCIAINYGIESGSQKILNNMNKRTTVEQNLNAIRKTLKAGMQAMAYIMAGYEGEDKETLDETSSMLLSSDLPSEYISIFYTVALPGTRLYQNCLKNGKIKDEDEYLTNMYTYVEEEKAAHERYIINLSDTSVANLVQWEKKLQILIKLNQMLKNHPLIFRMAKKLFTIIPTGDPALKLYSKVYHLLKNLKKSIPLQK